MNLIESTIQSRNQLPPGIANMDEATYRALPRLNPSALAAGLMSDMECDPTLIRDSFEAKTKRTQAQQDRLDRGTLAHLMILQSELVESRVAVWNGDRRAGKEYDRFADENANKLQIRADDFNEVREAATAVLNVPAVRKMFTGVETEVGILSEESGVYTKGRVDAIRTRDGLPMILDLKTTEAGIDRRSVMRTIREFHYREKMAFYRRMLAQVKGCDREEIACWNVFVKLPPPVSIRIVKFTSGALEWGEMRMMSALESVRQCIESATWPVFVGDDMADVDPWEIIEEEVEVDYGT